MVATTFAADTPLAITELVARHGVAGNWLWWSMAAGGMLTVFGFAPLWWRSGVFTDVEFTEFRYAGKPAAFLRGFRALYFGILVNAVIMGWVHLGMVKILGGTLGIGKISALLICFVLTVAYSTLAGLWGVAVTDAFQFVIAMFGTILLAIFGLRAVGGWSQMLELVGRVAPPDSLIAYGSSEKVLAFFPDGSQPWMLPGLTLAVFLFVNWWASWYPGAEPGGGGYIAQRIFSCRNEREGLLATLWFNVAHYAVRPWPWIVAALCSVALYANRIVDPATGRADPALGYVRLMAEVLPAGFRGVLLAAFGAAYMSTISTQLNWGASYLVHDFYRRFIKTSEPERHYVQVAKCSTIGLALVSLVVAYLMHQITHGWEFLFLLGAGTGSVYLLRWYWWRVNAWSEISAMIAALVVSVGLRLLPGWETQTPGGFALTLVLTVALTTIVWVSVTFWTPPEPHQTLAVFCARVRPAGPGWNRLCGVSQGPPLRWLALQWGVATLLVYAFLFGIGLAIYGKRFQSVLLLGLGSGLMIWMAKRLVNRGYLSK